MTTESLENTKKGKKNATVKQQLPTTNAREHAPVPAASAPPAPPSPSSLPPASPSPSTPSPPPAPTPPSPLPQPSSPAPASKEQKQKPKEEAVARLMSAPISKKHAMALCTFIKGKSAEAALSELEQVIAFKRAVQFRGEIPHRHGKGVMSGRYPINASKAFISLLKGLRGNIAVAGLDAERARITFASASWASRPSKGGGMRFKRTHVILKAREVPMNAMKEDKPKGKAEIKQEEKK